MKQLKIIKLLAILVVFATMLFLDSSLVFSQKDSDIIHFEKNRENLSDDSPFLNPKPRLDPEAASKEKMDDIGRQNYLVINLNNKCWSLPQNIWVLLAGAYLFLLVFNLVWDFEKSRRIHWFWETFYTLLALLAWNAYDGCRQHTWFPMLILEIGLITYAFYFYFASRRARAANENTKKEPEKTARLPFE